MSRPRPAPQPASPFDAALPALMNPNADLPLPKDPFAALPMPADLAPGLPAVRDFSLDLPSPARNDADLPAVREFSADLPTSVDVPNRGDLPAVIDFSSFGAADLPSAYARPADNNPSLDSFDLDEADLPIAEDDLPTPLATALPSPLSAALPAPLGDNLPSAFGADLPIAFDLPMSTGELPSPVEGLFGADLPAVEPDPLPPVVTAPNLPSTGSAKIGRIGLERKAFPVSSVEDLPAPSVGGAALPAAITRGPRANRRTGTIDPEDFPPRKPSSANLHATGPSLSDFPAQPDFSDLDRPHSAPPPQGGNFGELDLGPMEAPMAQPSLGFVHPSGAPGALNDPSLPPLDNPFDPSLQSVLPPAISMQPAPIADEILNSINPPIDSLLPPTGASHSLSEFEPATTATAPEKGGRFGKKKLEAPPDVVVDESRRRFKSTHVLYGALGLVGVLILGGAALALTPYGAFGKNWIDETLHGDERLAAANRVIQLVERTLEHDTYERAVASLRRLDEALARVPQVKELQAYIVYANNMVAGRFGPDPSRIGRARQVLAQLVEAPPGMRYLNLARASDALVRGDARNALRLAKLDPVGRDLATLAAQRLGDNDQWFRLAQQGRQRRASPRSRYFLALAAQARGDHETARREAEEVLRSESRHAGARILLARLLARFEPERDRALELLRDLVRDGGRAPGGSRNGAPPANLPNPSGASTDERAEGCVVAGQIELVRDRVSAAQARFQRALELDPRSASALVGIGQILYRQGNFADAQARFRNAYSADRNNLEAVIGIAQSSLALNQATEAKSIIEPALRDHANDGRLHYWLGKALAATSDQRTVAQQSFREAIRLQPENLDAYVSLSELFLLTNHPESADQVLQEARSRVPENAAIHRALAHGRLARADLPGAEAELRIAIQREPDDIRSHFALGDVLRRMSRLDAAQTEFEFVTRADPNYPGLAMARGLLSEARGELPAALSTFREALARDPTNVDLINRVAFTLLALGNNGDADQMLRSVVVDHPTNADAQYITGRARLGLGNFVDAVHYLDRAIELNPQRAEYKAYAAEAHRRTGDIQRALQLAEQSIELDSTFPRGFWVRAEIRLHRSEAADALADINRATQLDPRFWAAYATWADIDDALGQRSDAIRLYRFAIEHDPTRHGDWYYNLGRLLADAGDEGGAREALTQARALGTGLAPPVPTWYAQATRALADIEREHHNRAEAQRLYTEYLRIVPQGSPAYNSAAIVLSDMIRQ